MSQSDGTLNLNLNGSGALVSTNPDDGVPGHKGFQFTYGYVEARIYLPGSGSQIANWPAFWTDGQSWPTDGEMDIMEGLSGSAAYHFHSDAGGPGANVPGNYTGWHTFAADWEPGSVTYYYDGRKVGQLSSGITSAPMYLIIENSAQEFDGPSVQPSVMKVAWVRVWQKPGQWSSGDYYSLGHTPRR
ncbi:glycoside hydrolase family 16 protein [Alicyclobacillus fodiniaquatilis]|uniref:Family 16 glycosylhydrolase n=1 Tax=Alicyclobacillus fodiniaquatilis TaxID=1661150 RepID=A0ABW4JI14_9BACL